MPLITIFLQLPHFDEKICREIDVPALLPDLKDALEVSTGQELLCNHPRFLDAFSLVEETRQLWDGCSVRLVIPRRRLFVRDERVAGGKRL